MNIFRNSHYFKKIIKNEKYRKIRLFLNVYSYNYNFILNKKLFII